MKRLLTVILPVTLICSLLLGQVTEHRFGIWFMQSGTPSQCVSGYMWMDTTTNLVKVCSGGSWVVAQSQALTQYTTPTAGATVTVTAGRNVTVLLNPAGTLATLTVALQGSPVDGDIVTIGTSQIITVLTVSGGTLVGTLTTLALGGYATFQYNSTATKWFRIG